VVDEEDLYTGFISEAEYSDQSSGSDFEESTSEKLLHSCSYCPKLTLDISRQKSDENDILRGDFSFDLEQMYNAAANGCKFLARFTGPVETMLKSNLRARQTLTQLARPDSIEQDELKSLGVVLSTIENSYPCRFEAKVKWAKKDGSFVYPGMSLSDRLLSM